MNFSFDKTLNLHPKYNPENFILGNINLEPIEDGDEIGYVPTMLLMECDEEEGKEGKGIKILTPN